MLELVGQAAGGAMGDEMDAVIPEREMKVRGWPRPPGVAVDLRGAGGGGRSRPPGGTQAGFRGDPGGWPRLSQPEAEKGGPSTEPALG